MTSEERNELNITDPTFCGRLDCFANRDGGCAALSDTYFPPRKVSPICKTAEGEEQRRDTSIQGRCPFFKTREQNERQKNEAKQKWFDKTGLDHYVYQNSGMEAKG